MFEIASDKFGKKLTVIFLVARDWVCEIPKIVYFEDFLLPYQQLIQYSVLKHMFIK